MTCIIKLNTILQKEKKSCKIVLHFLQLNKYEKAPKIFQLSQNLTSDCLLIFICFYQFLHNVIIGLFCLICWKILWSHHAKKTTVSYSFSCTRNNLLHTKKNLNLFFFQHSCILEYCVEQLENKDPPVHNYLLSLYIKHQPEAVWPYFQRFKG